MSRIQIQVLEYGRLRRAGFLAWNTILKIASVGFLAFVGLWILGRWFVKMGLYLIQKTCYLVSDTLRIAWLILALCGLIGAICLLWIASAIGRRRVVKLENNLTKAARALTLVAESAIRPLETRWR